MSRAQQPRPNFVMRWHDDSDGDSDSPRGRIDVESDEDIQAMERAWTEGEASYDLERSNVPEGWLHDDGPSQEELTQNILAKLRVQTSGQQAYDKIRKKTLLLSKMRKLHERRADQSYREEAMNLATQKVRLEIDEDMKYDWDSPDIVWSKNGIFLDLRVLVSNRIGLDALLPNTTIPRVRFDPNWTFRMSVDQRHRPFQGDIDFLPFDPNGRVVYLGSVRQHEHVYVVFTPRIYVGRTSSPDERTVYKGIKTMDSRSARAVFVMLGYMLSKINYRTLLFQDYPDLDSDQGISEFVCNIL
ncbi:hypothetical protein BD311DRAFT_812685 [Dichomitus squalens]|uniref:DUF8190 domain-containing protein n=1 Tax=Dichomitus squalens TaxID=114155 RepID=A0A4Q9M4Z7_9APHY|nr:hypothetical protein BD311DRAFT_812685 [Dichomitus squalens]